MALQLPTRERLRELSKERPTPAMIQDIVRALITRVMQDKILMGLVILGVLAVFVVPNVGDKEPPPSHGSNAANAPPAEVVQAVNGQGQGAEGAPGTAPGGAATPNPASVDPKTAAEFVKFWMGGSMDYNAQTAAGSHKEAFKWMTPEAQQSFETHFWPPEIANNIASGQLSGSFQPISVTPQAINPDGSIVVELTGTLVLQSSRVVTHQIVMDVLVKKDSDNYRIAGLYNRSYPTQQ